MTDTATQPDPHADELLPPRLARRLDRLDVISRKILSGKLQGERRSKKRGRSVEFADYRPYVHGDDLRFVDWNLYARLDRFFLKLFMEEEDLSVSILLDSTRSMDYGTPNKLWHAKQLAAAVGYAALAHSNRVHFYSLAGPRIEALAGLRGRRQVPRVLDFLRDIEPGPGQPLREACRSFTGSQPGKGVVILLSDLLDKGDLTVALTPLALDRYDVYVVHLLAPQETDPAIGELTGDVALVDLEDDDLAEITLTPGLIKRYKAGLESYRETLRLACVRRGMAYVFSETSMPVEDLVLRYFREWGVLGP